MSEKYEPSQVEDSFYKIWEDRGYFDIDGNQSIQEHDANGKQKTFSIMMPPPNVTGSLHIGHALTFTLQDIITSKVQDAVAFLNDSCQEQDNSSNSNPAFFANFVGNTTKLLFLITRTRPI